MVAAKKLEPNPQNRQHSERLEKLLLDKSYNMQYSTDKTTKEMTSRIEAESKLERLFLTMC